MLELSRLEQAIKFDVHIYVLHAYIHCHCTLPLSLARNEPFCNDFLQNKLSWDDYAGGVQGGLTELHSGN